MNCWHLTWSCVGDQFPAIGLGSLMVLFAPQQASIHSYWFWWVVNRGGFGCGSLDERVDWPKAFVFCLVWFCQREKMLQISECCYIFNSARPYTYISSSIWIFCSVTFNLKLSKTRLCATQYFYSHQNDS